MDRHKPPLQVPAADHHAAAAHPNDRTSPDRPEMPPASPARHAGGYVPEGAPSAVDVPRLLRYLSVRHASDVFLGEIAPEAVATPSLNGASSEELPDPSEFRASSRGGGFRIAIDAAEYQALLQHGAVVVEE